MRRNTLTNVVELAVKTAHAHRIARQVVAKLAADSVKSIGGVPLPKETGPGAVRSLLSQVANTPSQVASAVSGRAKSMAAAPVTTPLPQLTRPPKVDPPKVTEPEVPIVKSIGGVPLPAETGPGAVRSLLSQVANTPESVGRAVADGAKSMAAAPVTTPLPQLTRPPKVDPPKVDPPKVDPPKVPIVKSIGGVPLPKETGPGAVRKMLGQIANTPEEISNAVVSRVMGTAASSPLANATSPAAAPENEFQKLRAIKDNAAYGLAFDTMRKSWQPSDDPLVNIERLGASKDYAKRFPQATVGSEGWLTPEVQESMAKQSLTTPGGITTPELLGDFAPHARFSRAASNATGGDTSAVTEMGAQLKLVGEAAYKKSIGTAQNPTPEQVTAAQSAAAAAQDAVKAWHARNGEAVGWTSSVAARVSSDKGAAAALDKSVIESAKLRVEEMTKNGVSATSAMKNTGIIDWITQNPKSLLVAGGVLAMLFGGKTGLVLGSIAAAFGGADLYQKYQNAQSVAAQNIFALTSDTYAKTLKEDGAPAAANYMANVEAALRKPTGDPARDSANNGALTIFTLNSMHPQFIADRIRQQGIEAISPIVGQGAADAAFTEPAPTVTP